MHSPFKSFLLGLILGACFMYIGLYFYINSAEYKAKSQMKEKLINHLTNVLDSEKEAKEDEAKDDVQYIEVKTKKSSVMLYVGMKKDSVKVLLGKPNSVRVSTYRGSIDETWEYKINNRHIEDLTIEFKDSQLSGVNQRDYSYMK